MPFLGPLTSKWHHTKNKPRKVNHFRVFLGAEVSRVRWLSIARVFECACVCVCLCKMASLVRSAPSALWFLRPSRCPYAEFELSHTPTWTPLLRPPLTHTQHSWHQSLTAVFGLHECCPVPRIYSAEVERNKRLGDGFGFNVTCKLQIQNHAAMETNRDFWVFAFQSRSVNKKLSSDLLKKHMLSLWKWT